jgi:hypothetical protein
MPTTAGIASFAISFGGISCSISLVVNGTAPQQPQLGGMDCDHAIVSGNAYAGVLYSGIATVPYSGGNGAIYPFPGPNVSSTGVTGLIATLQPDTLNVGSGNLIYTISGTPSAIGVAYFAIDFGGQACTLRVNVYDLPFDFTIQPNPVESQLLKVKFRNPTSIAEQLWIYDAAGRLVMNQLLPDLDAGLPIGKLASGTYSLKILDQRTHSIIVKSMVISKH